MRGAWLSLFLISAGCATASEPLTAEAFERRVTGRTILYGSDGIAYGAEEYRPGRRVTFSYLDGECLEGTWRPAGEMICFDYVGRDRAQCWTYRDDGGRMTALFTEGRLLHEMGDLAEGLVCLGPVPGV